MNTAGTAAATHAAAAMNDMNAAATYLCHLYNVAMNAADTAAATMLLVRMLL